MVDTLVGVRIGFAMCGSFCTFAKAIVQMESLVEKGAQIIPIMSETAYSLDTRFGAAKEHIHRIESICGRKIISTIDGAEPIGPKNMTDVMVVAPCTGNTLSKLACSMTDTAVTMAVKSHLRNNRPVVINCATNDGLAGTLKNIGYLMNCKNYYFVPLRQDDFEKKPSSIVSDFKKITETVNFAINGKQIQPLLD